MNARDLSDHLAALLRREREVMADFLLALAAFDDEKLWRDLGHTSLFYYLRRELGLSAGAAQHRKTAVELIQQFPAVETALRQGHLCLSSVCELAKVVTPENVAEVLPRFFGLSRREAEAVAASIRPAAAIPQREVVTPVRTTVLAPTRDVPRQIVQAEPKQNQVHLDEPASRTDLVLTPPAAPAPARPPDSAQPLTEELSRVHLTVSRQFMETLEQTKDALSLASGREHGGDPHGLHAGHAGEEGSSATTSTRRPSAGVPRSRTSGPRAGGIISLRRGRRLATRSWTASRACVGRRSRRTFSARPGRTSAAGARSGMRVAETLA
jgi:hypothetical protein